MYTNTPKQNAGSKHKQKLDHMKEVCLGTQVQKSHKWRTGENPIGKKTKREITTNIEKTLHNSPLQC